jgi:hypothetical protein
VKKKALKRAGAKDRGMLQAAVRVVEKESKSMRDDPVVKDMTTLLNAGRAAERMDILDELDGWLRGSRGWAGGVSPEERVVLTEFKRWVEQRGRGRG